MKKTLFKFIVLFGISAIMSACLGSSTNSSDSSSRDNFGGGDNSTGTGGSLARFTIVGNKLYTVSENTMTVFDISNPTIPRFENELNVGEGIETIFPMQGQLLLGARNGMHIYSLANPSLPNRLSFTEHIISCDPVVGRNNVAYVTLSSAEVGCFRGINTLQVYDISNPSSPVLNNSIAMSSPMGLGVSQDLLFVCDTRLKVFDVSNELRPTFIKELTMPRPIDVVAMPDKFYVLFSTGFSQYSISGNDFELISSFDYDNN